MRRVKGLERVENQSSGMVLLVLPWRSCGCNVPGRLRQKCGVDLPEAMSARRAMLRETSVATFAIRHTCTARWQGRVAKLPAITHSAQVSQQLIEPCGVDRVLRSLCDQTTSRQCVIED